MSAAATSWGCEDRRSARVGETGGCSTERSLHQNHALQGVQTRKWTCLVPAATCATLVQLAHLNFARPVCHGPGFVSCWLSPHADLQASTQPSAQPSTSATEGLMYGNLWGSTRDARNFLTCLTRDTVHMGCKDASLWHCMLGTEGIPCIDRQQRVVTYSCMHICCAADGGRDRHK
jgi:hypothetical protein